MAKVGRGMQIPLSWVPGSDGFCPVGAITVDNVCVARCKHSGELLPGKLVPMNGKCYCSYGGAEIESYNYEVLCESFIPGSCRGYCWETAYDGDVPKNAIVAGIAKDGQPLYIVKGSVNGETCFGKLHEGHSCAYLPWGGKEHSVSEYDVLVWQKY
ncbi:Natterin-4 [Schistosoma japonicum]|uniref:DM9 domain-containing protein n=1 Tax=Schistosoma japonicum TaxID=6182 RepID=C1L4J3_SCHJA|nr:Natterin-4 [Schistosoma japonicum]TNN12830.1 Natterin-4 [Schistosoma japonicum]TNN12831.1 Natterin-4 [Schistosoma japonicum]CAX69621.1 DM9 domain-containing protein [Schistosoma japonicum]